MPKNGSELQKQCLENLLVGQEAPFRKSMRPELIRLAPPLYVDQDEVGRIHIIIKLEHI